MEQGELNWGLESESALASSLEQWWESAPPLEQALPQMELAKTERASLPNR